MKLRNPTPSKEEVAAACRCIVEGVAEEEVEVAAAAIAKKREPLPYQLVIGPCL